MKQVKKTKDFTEGVIWKQLLLFSLPLIGSSLIQQLYNTVDLIFVGQYLGKDASAAVGASSLLVTCLVGFFTGMSVGSSVVAAQGFGSRDEKKLSNAVHTSFGIAFVGGILLSVFGILIAPLFLRLMQTPEEIMGIAVSYVRIYFIGFTAMVVYNIGSGVLRAVGDVQFTLYAQLAGGILHVFLDALFLMAFGWGVQGVAASTAISQAVSAVLVMARMMYTEEGYKLSLGKIAVKKKVFFDILLIGVPAGLQAMVITLSNMFGQYHINSFGVDAMAAFTAYFKVELVLYLPIVAFGQAVTTFVGQNIGAGNYGRVRKCTSTALKMGVSIILLISVLMIIFLEEAFGVFSKDAQVTAIGMRIARITFPFYFFYLIMEVLADTVRGAGRSVAPMVIIMVNICGLRIALMAVIMSVFHDVRGIAVTYPITWAAAALCLVVYYYKGAWRKK